MMADDTTQPYYTVMTDAAMTLISQMANGQNSIKSFRPVASDENHWGEDLATTGALTDIGSIQQTGTVQDLYQDSDDDPTKLVIQIDFDETKIDTSYSLNTLGLYATDQNGSEILYAVECLQHAQPMDKSTTAGVNTHYMTVGVGKASQVQLTITDVDDVSKDELAKTLVDYVKAADIKTVAYTDKQNNFTMQQTFSAGAVDGSGNKYVTENNVPKTDLSGLQPKGDYANNADLTALKNTVNSTTSGLPSKLATTDADKKYETSAHASSTYETQADAKNKVNTADTSNWQKQALFNPGSFAIDHAGDGNGITFHDLLVQKYANPGVYFIRDSATTAPQNYYVDALVISEFGGYWYCYGIVCGNSIFVTRTIQPDKTAGRIDSGWVPTAQSKDVQSAINQAHTDMTSELTKRGYPSAIWTGTQAQYDAMNSHDAHTEYRITG